LTVSLPTGTTINKYSLTLTDLTLINSESPDANLSSLIDIDLAIDLAFDDPNLTTTRILPEMEFDKMALTFSGMTVGGTTTVDGTPYFYDIDSGDTFVVTVDFPQELLIVEKQTSTALLGFSMIRSLASNLQVAFPIVETIEEIHPLLQDFIGSEAHDSWDTIEVTAHDIVDAIHNGLQVGTKTEKGEAEENERTNDGVQGGKTCDGYIVEDTGYNLTVQAGATCYLQGGIDVTGNIEVFGGTLIVSGSSTVLGNILGQDGASITVRSQSVVTGNIENLGPGGYFAMSYCNVHGNVETRKLDEVTLEHSTLGGNFSSSNDTLVTAIGNTIGGNLEFLSPGTCTESNNTYVGRYIGCAGEVEDVGNGNGNNNGKGKGKKK